jgi:hypothetical protein
MRPIYRNHTSKDLLFCATCKSCVIRNKSFQNVATKYSGTTVINRNYVHEINSRFNSVITRGPFGPTRPGAHCLPSNMFAVPDRSPIYLQSALTILSVIHASLNV